MNGSFPSFVMTFTQKKISTSYMTKATIPVNKSTNENLSENHQKILSKLAKNRIKFTYVEKPPAERVLIISVV